MKIRSLITCMVIATMLAGCASSAKSITPTYVSPMQYQSYNCDQIREEMHRVSNRVSEVTGQQNRASTNDAIAMTVGLVIFWPALFFLMSDNDKSDQLSRLMGEHEALQQAGIQEQCFSSQERQAIEAAQS